MSAMLHTWGQTLTRHVHLHCLIPGGALSTDGARWEAARSTYLFPVKALSRRFRGIMVAALRRAYTRGELFRISAPSEVDERLDTLMQSDWVVYSKPYLKTPETVVKYLARYTHRIAISNARILAVDATHVDFAYRDYRDRDQMKVMSLSGEEFIRRFLLHVLPKRPNAHSPLRLPRRPRARAKTGAAEPRLSPTDIYTPCSAQRINA